MKFSIAGRKNGKSTLALLFKETNQTFLDMIITLERIVNCCYKKYAGQNKGFVLSQ